MNHDAISDEELTELARAAACADAAATERLFLALLPRVRNLVRYLLRGDLEVDDLTQEALLMILRGIGTYRGEGSFRSWCDRVVARSVFGRKRKPQLVPLEEENTSQELAENHQSSLPPDTFTLRRQLVAALDQLPEAQRSALVLHFAAGLSVPEVAEELDAPEETVRSRLRLGKARLKELLGDVPARMVS